MRNYELEVALDLRAAVPEEFTADMREQAKAEDASEFLKEAQEKHPEDDDAFTLHILKHGLRRHIRQSVVELFESSGLGGTFAPPSIVPIDFVGKYPEVPAQSPETVAEVVQG